MERTTTATSFSVENPLGQSDKIATSSTIKLENLSSLNSTINCHRLPLSTLPELFQVRTRQSVFIQRKGNMKYLIPTARQRECRRSQRSIWSLQHGLLVALILAVVAVGSLCEGFVTGSNRSPGRRLSESQTTKICLKSDGLTPEERDAKIQKATKAMTAFTNTYLKKSETFLCDQKSIPAVVIKGLAEHKVDLGAPLCPCRFYEDKEKEVKEGYWNCPCVPMREEKVCHCMLFLTEDNAFAGESQVCFTACNNTAFERRCSSHAQLFLLYVAFAFLSVLPFSR